MDFDDVVIGSGMAALGVVLGLESRRRVLVLAGPAVGEYAYYDQRKTVPCAYLGAGGLGNDWHGVIPTGLQTNFGSATTADFADLFARFYPNTDIQARLGKPWLFVPWHSIRPIAELTKLARSRADRLQLMPELAKELHVRDSGVDVSTDSTTFRSRRVWIAAGALHTPTLLARSFGGRGLNRGLVSDHVLCYLGQVRHQPAPEVTRTRDGMFVPAQYGAHKSGLYTRRPARFAFRRLDHGIEQRAVFGMPTGNAVKKILRRMSPGLLAEAFYNRFGLFASADMYTVYAQVLVNDAYALQSGTELLRVRPDAIRSPTEAARRNHPFDHLTPSGRPEIYIPGIHLHHSVDLEALARVGLNEPASPVQIVDASVLSDIGPDHHTFKMLLAARARARELTN